MKALCLISLLFSFVVTALFVSALQTNKNLLATNAELLVTLEDVRKHPVHDAEITVWKRDDGNLLIIVNGRFPHVLRNPCANQRAL